MKHNKLLILSPLFIACLASCGSNPSSSQAPSSQQSAPSSEIETAIASLRKTSHTATLTQEVFVNQVYELAVDGYVKTESTFTHSYGEDGERAYKEKGVQYFGDLVKGTKEIAKDDEGNPILTKYNRGEHLYFCDKETGVVVSESIDASNRINKTYQSEYDYEAGTYVPVVFVEEFRNPFDYIEADDLTKQGEGTYALTLDKGVFMLSCYGATAPNALNTATVKVENGKITSCEFLMDIEGGEGYSYTRTTEFHITFTDYGEGSVLHHIERYNNDNPALKAAFDTFSAAQNYKYSKDYLYSDGSVMDHIQGYFTQEASFYHHHDSPDDEHVYILGDDYDYMAVYSNDESIYYGYEWSAGELPATCGQITLSESAYYTIDTFRDLGTQVYKLDPAIFVLKEGTTNTYILEDDKVAAGIAAYFDFQFLGVNSQVLETRTNGFELVLDDDGSFTVHTGYAYSEYGYERIQDIDYRFDVSSIGTTTLPSYILPLPTPHPML